MNYIINRKIHTLDQCFEILEVKKTDDLIDKIGMLLEEGYTEKSVVYALSLRPVQFKIANYRRDDRLPSIIQNEVRKYAYKSNDARWDIYNKNKFDKEKAKEDRKDYNVKVCASKKYTGYVYFIQSINGGPVKIGYSVDPKKRINEIQTGFPYKLVLIGYFSGNVGIERTLHRYLKHAKTNGEWFLFDETVKSVMNNCLMTGSEYVKNLE